MTIQSTRVRMAAILLAACASTAILATPALAQRAPSTSASVGRHLQAAQKAAQANDLPKAKEEVAAAKEAASSDFDKYKAAQMEMYVDVKMNDMAGAAVAAQEVADSPAQPEAEKIGNLNPALLLSMNSKNYPKAVVYAKALEATNPTDPNTIEAIGNAYYLGGDFAAAKAHAEKAVAAAIAAGKKPGRNTLQVLLSAQVSLKDEAGAEDTLEKLVAYYNQPEDWQQMIDVAFGTKGIRDVDAVWLGRLLFLSGATVSQNDATMIGGTASHLSFFGDASIAKQKGGTVDPDPIPRMEADKKDIQAQIALGQGPKGTGTYNAKLAEALYGYGMYAEAEATAKLAISKGGNPDTSEAPMVLGQAQAAQGKYDEALATFGTVTGGGPATARITRLWVDYVNIKKAPPVADAAPAQAAAK